MKAFCGETVKNSWGRPSDTLRRRFWILKQEQAERRTILLKLERNTPPEFWQEAKKTGTQYLDVVVAARAG